MHNYSYIFNVIHHFGMIFPFTQPSLHFQCLAGMANPLFCSLRSLLLPQIKHGWKIPELNGGFVRWENHL